MNGRRKGFPSCHIVPPAMDSSACFSCLAYYYYYIFFFSAMAMAMAIAEAASNNDNNPGCMPRNCTVSDAIPPIPVLYPFGIDEGCGASSAFLFSCESNSSLRWIGFNRTLLSNEPEPESDAKVIGIWNGNDPSASNYINLTWNSEVLQSHYTLNDDGSNQNQNNNSQICEPIPSNQLGQYLPSSGINLNADDMLKSFHFSDHSIFLLFNCSSPNSSPDPELQKNTTACQSYNETCSSFKQVSPVYNTTRCVQLYPEHELDVPSLMKTMKCSHFQLIVSPTANSLQKKEYLQWKLGMIQLTWQDESLPDNQNCVDCQQTGGNCGYNHTSEAFQCICSNGSKITSTVCPAPSAGSWKKIVLGLCIPLGVMAFILALVILLRRRRRSRRYLHRQGPTHSRGLPLVLGEGGPDTPRKNNNNKLWTQRALTLSSKFGPVSPNVKEFAYEELVKATGSFSEDNMIGDGGFGVVFLGVLPSGHKVAIKRLYHDNFRRMDQFYNEMKILSSFRHPNLVRLYGFCCQDDRDLLLVFEYASKGTVWDQLHGEKSNGTSSSTLSWKVRLGIACETAQALSYLHNNVLPPIYHRDVKTTNLLLDEELHVKVADFGLSRLVPLDVTHISTAPQGTPGYVDPDYHKCYQLTDKSDVYSFGVVLVELVSAQAAVDTSRKRGEINLSSLALTKIASGVWKELVDPSLDIANDPHVEKMVKSMLELAFTCLQEEKDDRPSMKEVAGTLLNICKQSGYEYGNIIHEEDVVFTKSYDGDYVAKRTKSNGLIHSDISYSNSLGSVTSSTYMSSF